MKNLLQDRRTDRGAADWTIWCLRHPTEQVYNLIYTLCDAEGRSKNDGL